MTKIISISANHSHDPHTERKRVLEAQYFNKMKAVEMNSSATAYSETMERFNDVEFWCPSKLAMIQQAQRKRRVSKLRNNVPLSQVDVSVSEFVATKRQKVGNQSNETSLDLQKLLTSAPKNRLSKELSSLISHSRPSTSEQHSNIREILSTFNTLLKSEKSVQPTSVINEKAFQSKLVFCDSSGGLTMSVQDYVNSSKVVAEPSKRKPLVERNIQNIPLPAKSMLTALNTTEKTKIISNE